jgi:hypothetical protein
VCHQREGEDFLEVSDDTGVIQIAEVGGIYRLDRANLIAAAPDLLQACKDALGAFENNNCIDWNDLTRAIAKAEGKL